MLPSFQPTTVFVLLIQCYLFYIISGFSIQLLTQVFLLKYALSMADIYNLPFGVTGFILSYNFLITSLSQNTFLQVQFTFFQLEIF